MMNVLWGVQAVLERGQTMNATRYCQTQRKAVCLTGGVILRLDNAIPHTSRDLNSNQRQGSSTPFP